MQISGTTKMLGVIGSPVEHSFSPVMQNAALRTLGLDYCYVALAVKPEVLSQGITGLRALGFKGFNITVPHKEQVMGHLDWIDQEALIIGAVNTVVNKDGLLKGYNTDGEGFLRSLTEEWGFTPQGEQVVMLGAGGAARAIACSLANAGTSKIILANRSQERSLRLKADLLKHYNCRVDVVDLGEGDLDQAFAECSLVVQTTSVGMHPREAEQPLVDPARLKSGTFVYDIIFNPQETRFLQGAKQQGCKVANGLGMLLHQGAMALELWTGLPAPVESMRQALLNHLQK